MLDLHAWDTSQPGFTEPRASRPQEASMSTRSNITRRRALAGIGAGSLATILGATAAANPHAPHVEPGTAPDISRVAMGSHRLNGRWLASIMLPSNPGVIVSVPSFFSPDGAVMMIFPGTEASRHGVEIRGVALGDWEPENERVGRFTAVQVLANLEGRYIGTMTIDGFAVLDQDDMGFTVRSDDHVFTLRDTYNAITEHLGVSATNPMRGRRMRAGQPGFAAPGNRPAGPNDPRTPH
jgi:hypothetical protein